MKKFSVVICGRPAIGKTTVAKAIAQYFNIKIVNGGDLLRDIAYSLGYSPYQANWWDTPDGIEFLRIRDKKPEYDEQVDAKMLELFQRGRHVFTSYTLPWIAPNVGIKIWLEGTAESAVKRMQIRDNIGKQEANRIAVTRFDENSALYKKQYGFDLCYDNLVFDAKISTDNLTKQEVINTANRIVADHLY